MTNNIIDSSGWHLISGISGDTIHNIFKNIYGAPNTLDISAAFVALSKEAGDGSYNIQRNGPSNKNGVHCRTIDPTNLHFSTTLGKTKSYGNFKMKDWGYITTHTTSATTVNSPGSAFTRQLSANVGLWINVYDIPAGSILSPGYPKVVIQTTNSDTEFIFKLATTQDISYIVLGSGANSLYKSSTLAHTSFSAPQHNNSGESINILTRANAAYNIKPGYRSAIIYNNINNHFTYIKTDTVRNNVVYSSSVAFLNKRKKFNTYNNNSQERQLFRGVSPFNAIAALNSSGKVIAWGKGKYGGNIHDPTYGVNYPQSADDLSAGIVQIYHTDRAFAAINNDGKVFTWGDERYGGNTNKNINTLGNYESDLSADIVEIYSTDRAFAALDKNGKVITWGEGAKPNVTYPWMTGSDWPPSMNSQQDLSSGIIQIYSTNHAFAAINKNGKVTAWGWGIYGGDITDYTYGVNYPQSRADLSAGIVQIYSNEEAFAALNENGKVITWGNRTRGGDINDYYHGASHTQYGVISPQLVDDLSSGIVQIYSTLRAFAALNESGKVITWGDKQSGGNIHDQTYGVKNPQSVDDLSAGIVQIYSNGQAFAAINESGKVITWGSNYGGGNIHDPTYGVILPQLVDDLSSGIVQIYSNSQAFAAINESGKVITWGNDYYGGNIHHQTHGVNSPRSVDDLSAGIVQIYSSFDAFAALNVSGKVITWGSKYSGGNIHDPTYGVKYPRSVDDLSAGIVQIYSGKQGFSAINKNGKVISWGWDITGGTSSYPYNNLSTGIVMISNIHIDYKLKIPP